MIFTIQTDDDVAGLDISNALDRAGVKHTLLSKQHDTAAQQSVQRTLPKAGENFKPCPLCGTLLPVQDLPESANR